MCHKYENLVILTYLIIPLTDRRSDKFGSIHVTVFQTSGLWQQTKLLDRECYAGIADRKKLSSNNHNSHYYIKNQNSEVRNFCLSEEKYFFSGLLMENMVELRNFSFFSLFFGQSEA